MWNDEKSDIGNCGIERADHHIWKKTAEYCSASGSAVLNSRRIITDKRRNSVCHLWLIETPVRSKQNTHGSFEPAQGN
jgi:hypothetical protein